MNDKLRIAVVNAAMRRFYNHFGYMPNFPDDIDFDTEKYAALIDKSIKEDTDHTIVAYGTKAAQMLKKRDPKAAIID